MSAVRVERDGPVLRVTLARPERRNALNPDSMDELIAAFGNVGDARAVVLSGDGPGFCAGADLEWMRASADLSFEENVEDASRLRRMLEAVDGCPAPLLAAVQGAALGAGSGLLTCCDIVVVARDAVFGFTEVKLGITPAVISPFVLDRIGAGAARRLFVTGERFDAETALRIGLVHLLADDLAAAVDAVVAELLSAAPEATRQAKQLARRPPAAEVTPELTATQRASAEGQEGLRAFLEKRPPSWHADPSK